MKGFNDVFGLLEGNWFFHLPIPLSCDAFLNIFACFFNLWVIFVSITSLSSVTIVSPSEFSNVSKGLIFDMPCFPALCELSNSRRCRNVVIFKRSLESLNRCRRDGCRREELVFEGIVD